MWKPNQPDYNLDDVAKKIKDETWNINYSEKEELDFKKIIIKPEVIRINGNKEQSEKKEFTKDDEIREAIERMKS